MFVCFFFLCVLPLFQICVYNRVWYLSVVLCCVCVCSEGRGVLYVVYLSGSLSASVCVFGCVYVYACMYVCKYERCCCCLFL